jgi:hypothetical protein
MVSGAIEVDDDLDAHCRSTFGYFPKPFFTSRNWRALNESDKSQNSTLSFIIVFLEWISVAEFLIY